MGVWIWSVMLQLDSRYLCISELKNASDKNCIEGEKGHPKIKTVQTHETTADTHEQTCQTSD